MDRLAGKVAFVTGAGGGIGQALCRLFLAEGARVAATDVDGAAARSAIGDAAEDRALALACDVGEAEEVRAAIGRAALAFGRIDVLCNLAGGSTLADGPVTTAPVEEFWRAIRLDLFGTFLVCKFGIPELVRAGGGSVVNMSSMVAVQAVHGKDCYTAAKGGVSALTRSMALEYAGDRVRVNAIAPSVTLTPRVRARMESGGGSSSLAPLHRLGFLDPEDVAQAALFLASDESKRVTGQIWSIDSGASIG